MAAFSTSFGSWAGFVAESTYGTAVSPRTNFMRLVSGNLARRVVNRPTDDLGDAGSTSRNRKYHFLERDDAGGNLTVDMAYDDSTIFLLKHALGAVSTSGAGPYVHTLSLSSPGQTGFTCEQALGDSGKSEVFEGCVINKATISCAFGEEMKLSLDVIAETSQGHVSSASPTYNTTFHPILHHHIGTLSLASLTLTLVSFEVSITRNKERRNLLGSANTAQPSERFLDVEGTFVIEYSPTANLQAAYLATTQGDGAFTVTDGTRSMVVNLQNLFIQNIDQPLQTGAGLIRQSCQFRCESDGTDQGITLVFTNANSSATAN